MALAFVTLLHLQVNHLQVEQHTYECKDDEEVPVTQVNCSPHKELTHHMLSNAHGIEIDNSTTLTEEIQELKSMKKKQSVTLKSKASSKSLTVHEQDTRIINNTQSVCSSPKADCGYKVEKFVFFIGYPRSGHSVIV